MALALARQAAAPAWWATHAEVVAGSAGTWGLKQLYHARAAADRQVAQIRETATGEQAELRAAREAEVAAATNTPAKRA